MVANIRFGSGRARTRSTIGRRWGLVVLAVFFGLSAVGLVVGLDVWQRKKRTRSDLVRQLEH